jgi:PAS domain-containing protein
MPLRREAETRLRNGTAPATKAAGTDLAALAVLQGMATTPGSASDALKLLHELQVHQVELDLQHEQLEQRGDELTRMRDQYVERFDFAPIAYCVVGCDGRIGDGNLAAAELFGLEQAALSGRRVDSFLSVQGQFAWLAILKRLDNGSVRETCVVQVASKGSAAQQCRVIASLAPSDRSIMLMLISSD